MIKPVTGPISFPTAHLLLILLPTGTTQLVLVLYGADGWARAASLSCVRAYPLSLSRGAHLSGLSPSSPTKTANAAGSIRDCRDLAVPFNHLPVLAHLGL